jgi:hypothetical protein
MLNRHTTLFLLFSLLIVVFSGAVNAAPPFQTSASTSGLDIVFSKVEAIKQYKDTEFDFHIYNTSNGYPMNQSKVSCLFHLYDPMGNHQDISNGVTFVQPNEFQYDIMGNNFSTLGTYSFIFQCNSSNSGGYASGPVSVTTNGDSRDYGVVLILGIFGILVFLFGYYEHNVWFIYISGILFLILGTYILIYGLNSIKDTFTDPIGYVALAFGIFFFVMGGYEQLAGNEEETEEE